MTFDLCGAVRGVLRPVNIAQFTASRTLLHVRTYLRAMVFFPVRCVKGISQASRPIIPGDMSIIGARNSRRRAARSNISLNAYTFPPEVLLTSFLENVGVNWVMRHGPLMWGGRPAYHAAQAASAPRGLSAIRRTEPSRKRQRTAMHFTPTSSHASIKITLFWFKGMGRGDAFLICLASAPLHSLTKSFMRRKPPP